MMDRDTKLIAILRRQYHIILTALGENIFRIGLLSTSRQYIEDITRWQEDLIKNKTQTAVIDILNLFILIMT